MLHVDEFIDENYCEHEYARWVLHHFRLPAALKADFDQFMKDHKLFCSYSINGSKQRFRVTGASRLGDVWLAKDFKRKTGYDHRVDVAKCSEWSDKP